MIESPLGFWTHANSSHPMQPGLNRPTFRSGSESWDEMSPGKRDVSLIDLRFLTQKAAMWNLIPKRMPFCKWASPFLAVLIIPLSASPFKKTEQYIIYIIYIIIYIHTRYIPIVDSSSVYPFHLHVSFLPRVTFNSWRWQSVLFPASYQHVSASMRLMMV